MQLNEMLSARADQDRGKWFELAHPVTGKPTGIKLLVAGPDSETQARARLALVDELGDMTDHEGRVSGENREKARVRNLARCVLDWEIQEDSKPVPFNTENVIRLLRAGVWAQAQIDAFADNRRAHMDVRP
jgi:hypothetical protein